MSSLADSHRLSSIADMRVRTPRELGAVIKDRRLALRLDQAGLAGRVGVSRQWIIAIEQGKPHADVTLVLRTFDALGLRLDVTTDGGVAAGPARASHSGDLVFPDIDAIVEAARRTEPPPARAPGAPVKPSMNPSPKPSPKRSTRRG
jgi:HTH-type transcriptional regulator/antitoxin HipB